MVSLINEFSWFQMPDMLLPERSKTLLKIPSRSAACPLFFCSANQKEEGESKEMQHQDTELMDDEPVLVMSPEGNLQLLADTAAMQAIQDCYDSYEHSNDWNDIRVCQRMVREYKRWVKVLEEENARALSEIQRLKRIYNDPDMTPPNSPSRAGATRPRLNSYPLDWKGYIGFERTKKRRLS